MGRRSGLLLVALVGVLLLGCAPGRDPTDATPEEPDGRPSAAAVALPDSGIGLRDSSVADSGSALPPTRRYVVQVGAFTSRAAAAALSADLGLMNLAAEVVREEGVYRVRIGPLATVSEARALGDRLKRDLGLDYWVDRR